MQELVKSCYFRNSLKAPTILALYPADFSPVYGDQMTLYNEILPEFQRFNAEVLGISVDGVWSHLAFSKDRNPVSVIDGNTA